MRVMCGGWCVEGGVWRVVCGGDVEGGVCGGGVWQTGGVHI